jgi:hypothetical protein
MGTGRLSVALLALLALVALAGCGQGTSRRSLSLRQVPLVPGATIVTHTAQCDRGANAFCAIEAVVVDRSFNSSGALAASEDHLLHRLGWKSSAGDDGDEVAADSPGQKVRVTFATAIDDLIGIDEHWIRRSRSIEMALDRTMFDRTPAMSIMVEVGPT